MSATVFSPFDAIDAFASLPVPRSALHERHLREIAEENAADPDFADFYYRGWEISFNRDAAYWGFEPIEAYRGGVDLDAPRISGRTVEEIKSLIDDEEDDVSAEYELGLTDKPGI